ncbi:MAG: hypothetical protein WC643_03490 [Parcubacteria group bacterium]|jgi:hypothetical protein
MKNLIAETIGKIKKENVRPDPRWKYLAKKYSIWTSFFAVALVAAAAFSVVYFLISDLDWDLYAAMRHYSFFYYLSLIPYFWIIPLLILVFFAFVGLRKTENGYRYDFSKIALVVFGSLLLFGILLVFSGFGRKMNMAMTRGFPGYRKLVVTKEAQWSQPEKGLLAGTINSISKNSIDLRDLAGNEWQVVYDNNTVVRQSVSLESGEIIKAIGQKEGNQIFQASEIRPWQGNGQIKKKNGAGNANGQDGPKGQMNGNGK